LLTPDEIAALERLAGGLRARAAAGLGTATTSARGHGTELSGHEPYQPGDDLRHLDWNATLRARTPLVRHFFREGDVALRVVVDASRSMGQKWPAARRLAAALAYVARRVDRQLAVDVLGHTPSPPTLPNHWLRYVSEQLAGDAGDRPLAVALAALRKLPARREQLVIVTDFADPSPPESLSDAIAIVARSHWVDVVHVVDAGDVRLPDAAAVQSPETDALRYPDDATRAGFARCVETWRADVARAAGERRLPFRRLDVTAPFDVVAPVAALVASWR